jgi:hypothetical protein
MLVGWLQQHTASPLILIWAAALLDVLRRGSQPAVPRLAVAVVLVLLLSAAHGALTPTHWLPFSGMLRDEDGVALPVQWAALAALLTLSTARNTRPVGWLSLLPLPVIAGQGVAALLVGVIVAGSGAVEGGQRGRWWLILGLAGMALAAQIDAESLAVWVALRGQGLGADPASLVVDLGEQAVRGLGWVGVLAAIRLRLQVGARRSASTAEQRRQQPD